MDHYERVYGDFAFLLSRGTSQNVNAAIPFSPFNRVSWLHLISLR